MNNYRLTASILSFILAVSGLPANVLARETGPRAASDSAETLIIDESEDSGEAEETEEIQDTVEEAESDSEEVVETAGSESGENLESADTEPAETVETEESGSGNSTGAGEDTGTAVTHEVRLPSGQEGILIRSAGSSKVSSKDSFTFYLSPAEGWKKGKNFSVKAGETVLKPVPVKTEDTEKPRSENPESEDSTPGSESGESAAGAGEDSAAGAGDHSAADKEKSGTSDTSSPQDALEKTLVSQGYEKYVIAEVTGDITVTVTGLEKITVSETDNPDTENETGQEAHDQDQAPAVDSSSGQEAPEVQEIPEEGALADEYAEGDSADVPDAGIGDVFEGESAYSDADGDSISDTNESGFPDNQENIVPGEENTSPVEEQLDFPSGTEEPLAPAGPQDEISDDEGSTVPGAAEEASNTGETDSGSDSAIEDGNAGNGAAEDNSGDSISENPANAGSTLENSEKGSSAKAPSSGTSDQSKPAEYPLWVGGTRVTENNCKDIAGDGKIVYDDASKTLTLKNASIKGRKESAAPVYYKGDKTLTITFSGDCSITDSEAGSGIVCENSSLILKGSGSLSVRTAAPSSGACIQAEKGELTISGGTVTAVSSDIGPGLSASKIKIENEVVKVEAGSSKSQKAVSAGSDIAIGSLLWITTPPGGKISDDKKTITTDAGQTADHAVIEPRPVYEVTFDPGEGSGDMDPEHVVKGGKLELPECTFTAPECKTFSGWKVGNNVYKAGDSVTVEKAFTATAQWKDSHSLEKIAKKEATCLDKGHKEYYKCKNCGKCFSDSAASKPIKESDTEIPALGHKWGDPSYTWAKDYSTVTAKRVCERDKTHTESEKVKTTKKGTDPTCTKEGKYTYTAVFSNKAFKKQVKNVTKPALGHNWGKHEFIWTQHDDGSYDCECRFTCTRDSSHKKTVDAEVKESLTLPTKTTDGRLYCTARAELNDEEYTDTLEDLISPAGNSGYRFTKATDTWKHDSKKDLDFTVKRYDFDMITYRAFSHITVDDRTVSTAYYDYWEGSLKLSIDDRYLNLLSDGRHTLTVEFKDGSVSRTFTVKEAGSKSAAPSTGDNSNSLLWILSFVSCAAVIAALMALRMKKKQQ